MKHIKIAGVGALSAVLLLGVGCEEPRRSHTTPSATPSGQATGGSELNQEGAQGGSAPTEPGMGGSGTGSSMDSGTGSSMDSGTGSSMGSKPSKKGHHGASSSTPDSQTR